MPTNHFDVIVPEQSRLRALPSAVERSMRMRVDALVYSADAISINWHRLKVGATFFGAQFCDSFLCHGPLKARISAVFSPLEGAGAQKRTRLLLYFMWYNSHIGDVVFAKARNKPAFQCGLEVRVQSRDSKLTKMTDFRHFYTVNKSRNLDASGTERPAKIRSCNVPTRPAMSHVTPSAQTARCSEFQLTVCQTAPHGQSSPIPAKSKARPRNRP
jgi:hypothetical protein